MQERVPQADGPQLARIVAALSPVAPEEEPVLALERVLAVLKEEFQADTVLALQHSDALTASVLASVPRDALPGGMTTPEIFVGALESGRSVYHQGEPRLPGVPRTARGSTAILPWRAPGTGATLSIPGAVLLIRTGVRPFTDAERRFLDSLTGLLYTLTQLQRATHRAEERSVFFDAIVRALPHGLLFVDESGASAWVNQPAAELLGISDGAVPIHQVARAMAGLRSNTDNSEQVGRRISQVLAKPDMSLHDDLWIFTSPVRRVLSVSTVPTRVRQIRGRLWLFIDVTLAHFARREIEEKNAALEIARKQADAANQAKSMFLASMSHEVRSRRLRR